MSSSTKDKAEKVLSKLLTGKKLFDVLSSSTNDSLLIAGKPMNYWRGYFRIKVDHSNMNPQTCIELSIKLMELNQEAAFYYAAASAKSQALKQGTEEVYNDKFWEIYQEYKSTGGRLPGQETLKTVANIESGDLNAAATLAEIEMKFWKNILESLANSRRLLEVASTQIAVDLKAELNDKMINNFNKNNKYNGG